MFSINFMTKSADKKQKQPISDATVARSGLIAAFNFPYVWNSVYGFRYLIYAVQLFRSKSFEAHPGAQGRSFICEARVQGVGDEFTESYVDSMNIKFYLAGIVVA